MIQLGTEQIAPDTLAPNTLIRFPGMVTQLLERPRFKARVLIFDTKVYAARAKCRDLLRDGRLTSPVIREIELSDVDPHADTTIPNSD